MSPPTDIEKAGGPPASTGAHDDDVATTTTIPEPVPGEPLELTPSKAAPGNSFLSRTISRVRTKDSIDPGPPPDGGAHAWFMASLAHLVIFNIWGLVNSFGIFQNYYVQVMQIGDESSVAWIGTVQTFVLYLLGTFSGRGLDAGYFKVQIWVGSLLYVLGMFLLSLCTTYWQVFLAQAICMGIGYGMVFVPTLALISTYFLKRRSIALAIAVTGSCSGGLVFPAIAERMLPRAGFAWTVRTMAFVLLFLAIISATFLKVSDSQKTPQHCSTTPTHLVCSHACLLGRAGQLSNGRRSRKAPMRSTCWGVSCISGVCTLASTLWVVSGETCSGPTSRRASACLWFSTGWA